MRLLMLSAGAAALAFAASAAIVAAGAWRDSNAEALSREHARALVAATQINGAMLHAFGALAAAGELAADGAGGAESVVRAAAKSRSVGGAVMFDRGGGVLAATADKWVEYAAAARRAAGADPVWAGIVVTEHGARAPALVRRAGFATIVDIIDWRALLPDGGDDILLVADASGTVGAASPKTIAPPGSNAPTALGFAGAHADRFFAESGRGAPLAVAAAPVSTGAMLVFTASPAPSPIPAVLRALLGLALPGLASLSALGFLLGMLGDAEKRLAAAAEEIERGEERYRLAANSARAGIFEWRVDSDQIELSEQIVALLRAPSTTITVSSLAQLAAQEDRSAIEAAFAKGRLSGNLDATFRVPSGHAVVWVEMRGVTVAEDGAAPRIIGITLDVTQRREAELRASALQRRLREAIDSFSGPFALWDARRRLLLWNRSFQNLFDLEPSVLRPGASYDAIAMACAAAIRREQSDPNDATIREIELVSGSWLRVQERRTAEGGLVTLGLDISTIRRQRDALAMSETALRATVNKLEHSEVRNLELARSFEEQKRRAEDASRAKSAFLANMSHELRTPLNAVIGFSEIMASELYGPLGDTRYQSYAKDIHASGQLLLDLINDVLDMAKIEAGKFNLTPRPLDPLEAVEQATRLVRRRAEEKGLQLLVDAKELPEIEADHRAVKQMLLNLLSNAVKFTEKGGILVEASPSDDGVMLRVIDTGRGIPKEHLHRIARPFEQVEGAHGRDHPGTGLGLALTKSLAEMHGGRLEIDSEEGRGTVVTIHLPRTFGGARASVETIAAE